MLLPNCKVKFKCCTLQETEYCSTTSPPPNSMNETLTKIIKGDTYRMRQASCRTLTAETTSPMTRCLLPAPISFFASSITAELWGETHGQNKTMTSRHKQTVARNSPVLPLTRPMQQRQMMTSTAALPSCQS